MCFSAFVASDSVHIACRLACDLQLRVLSNFTRLVCNHQNSRLLAVILTSGMRSPSNLSHFTILIFYVRFTLVLTSPCSCSDLSMLSNSIVHSKVSPCLVACSRFGEMHFLQCTRLAFCLAVRILRNWSFARNLRICIFGLGMRVILAQRAAKAIRIIGCACFGFLLHRSSEVMAKSSRLRSRNQQSRLPAIKRFAKRQSAVAFKTVTCDQGLVIRGGLTKKPIFMPTVDFQGRN